MPFGGQTYDPAQDKDRLTRQLWAVKNLMADGKWRTLAAITEVGLLAWDVAKGDKPLQEAVDWLTEHGGMDRQKALSILLKKVWRLL